MTRTGHLELLIGQAHTAEEPERATVTAVTVAEPLRGSGLPPETCLQRGEGKVDAIRV